jgi:hypothetical protein
MKKPVQASVATAAVQSPKEAAKAALIARLIARAELDYGCCGHSKPSSK